MKEMAVVHLGLEVEEFKRLTWGNFARLCLRKELKELDDLRKLRMILGAILHKDPRELIPLPGDWDHLKAHSKEEVEEMCRKFGVDDWIKN